MSRHTALLALLVAASGCDDVSAVGGRRDATADDVARDLGSDDMADAPDAPADAPAPPEAALDVAEDVPAPPDVAACGSAGAPCCAGDVACGPALECRDGLCGPCGDDLAACGGACRDVTGDPANCGACGRSCRADQRCAAGACVCAEERTACGGACVDPLRDGDHCGACGRSCAGSLPGATARCALGRCVVERCDDGRADCDGDGANGCEASLASDANHCGRCGARCDALPGRAVRCEGGRCVDAEACAAPLGDCGPAPGCEADLSRSVAHCGACGRACPARGGAARCVDGVCALTCDPGRGDCDGDAGDGCEADLAADVDHCGACGRRCAPPHATGDCLAGRCAVGACEAAWGDCDGDASNGCERDLAGDADHCGACGRRCVRAGAVAACAAGRCAIGACLAGRGDCDGDASDGCERDLTGDAANCGACGRSCRADQACRAGACGCREGAAVCDGACVDVRSDPRHCGACGAACASGVCSEGVCTTPAVQRSCLAAGTPGCGLVEVEGGTFTLGADGLCVPPGDPATCAGVNGGPAVPNVTVSSLAVDAYEVTVARFRAFVRARAEALRGIRARPVAYPGRSLAWEGAGSLPPENGSPRCTGDCTWTSSPGRFERMPVLPVDLWTAQEFCVWDGGRLPTEAEWEYVARGRAVASEALAPGRTYPWGEAVPRTAAPCDRAHAVGACAGDLGMFHREVGRFAPTGGVYDLAGNARELCVDHFDLYGPTSQGCWRTSPLRDPLCRVTRPTTGTVFRGGTRASSSSIAGHVLRVTARDEVLLGDAVGFRCVRSRP